MRNLSWPVHSDGRNKKFGEMTRDEQREQMSIACRRLKAEIEQPEVQAKLAALLGSAQSGGGV